MKIDIWGDIVCPFCYIGKRSLELALHQFEHADEVTIQWHSFELDPNVPAVPTESLATLVARKYGMTPEQGIASQEQVAAHAATVGLDFNWREASYGNTFDAHRLIHLADAEGLGAEAEERLFHAYFTEGARIGDRAELQRLGEEIGLPPERVRALLASDEYGDAVRADEAEAARLGITSVPFFVFDEQYGMSGAQPVDAFRAALDQVWQAGQDAADTAVHAAAAPGCDGDSCAI